MPALTNNNFLSYPYIQLQTIMFVVVVYTFIDLFYL
jgi:hypothetical protein